MAKEIERKFLVRNSTWKVGVSGLKIDQGYLSTDIDHTVRVRIISDAAFLTVKTRNDGITRSEWEYQIPVSDAEDMLRRVKNRIIKKRYIVVSGGKKWEIDEFLGDNAGLVVAEIELESEDEEFEKPFWLGEEVSDDSRYYNSQLIENPYKNWKPHDEDES